MLTRSKSKMTSLQDLHNLILTLQNEQKEATAKINLLENELETKEKRIQALDSRVEVLEGDVAILIHRCNLLDSNVDVLKNTCNLLDRKCDDNEQYSRRPSLRISNIPEAGNKESAETCVELVMDLLNKIPNVEISRDDIDRAHRVGKFFKNVENKDGINENVDDNDINVRNVKPTKKSRPRQMIVKFKSWDTRTAVYKGRKSLKMNKINLDLTKRRLELKKLAMYKAEGHNLVEYALSDVNCSICIKLKSGEFRYFNSEEELDSILYSLCMF